jgi:hypothetical protein
MEVTLPNSLCRIPKAIVPSLCVTVGEKLRNGFKKNNYRRVVWERMLLGLKKLHGIKVVHCAAFALYHT